MVEKKKNQKRTHEKSMKFKSQPINKVVLAAAVLQGLHESRAALGLSALRL